MPIEYFRHTGTVQSKNDKRARTDELWAWIADDNSLIDELFIPNKARRAASAASRQSATSTLQKLPNHTVPVR